MSELMTELKKAIRKCKHGYWYVPKYPTKYAKKRVENDGDDSYHYEMLPVRWRRGKKKYQQPINPSYIITSDSTYNDLKKLS